MEKLQIALERVACESLALSPSLYSSLFFVCILPSLVGCRCCCWLFHSSDTRWLGYNLRNALKHLCFSLYGATLCRWISSSSLPSEISPFGPVHSSLLRQTRDKRSSLGRKVWLLSGYLYLADSPQRIITRDNTPPRFPLWWCSENGGFSPSWQRAL